MGAWHQDPAYRHAARTLKAQRLQPCCLCNGTRGPIDYTDTTRGPHSFTAQHLTPGALGGTHDNLAPAHRICNEQDGGRIGADLQRIHPIQRSTSWPTPGG